MNSSTVSATDQALASQYNNVRKDVLLMGGDYGTTAGSANTYTLSIDAQYTAYAAGDVIKCKINVTNTSSSTINVNSIGAKNILRQDLTAVQAGDLVLNQLVYLVYDGTQFQLLSNFERIKNKLAMFGGDGSDGAQSGALTVTGSDNTYIVKNYTSFTPGANTVTITPVNCVLHIKVSGNCDLTGTTFSFSGKGGAGGTGGAAVTNSAPNSGTNGTSGVAPFIVATNGVGSTAGVSNTPGTGGSAPSLVLPLSTNLDFVIRGGRSFPIGCGAGGGGGSGGSIVTVAGSTTGGAGGAGGAGGGCVILEVAGNLTFSGTTVTCAGVTGSNGGNGTSAASNAAGGGGGGGGGGGTFIALYNGTLSGSVTPTVSGGSGGSGGTGVQNDGGNPRASGGAGSGGSSQYAAGVAGASGGANNATGGAGGAGGAGQYLIAKNTSFL